MVNAYDLASDIRSDLQKIAARVHTVLEYSHNLETLADRFKDLEEENARLKAENAQLKAERG